MIQTKIQPTAQHAGVTVTLTQCELRYHSSEQTLFSQLNLTLPKGQWSCILGKSGCGKTSLLRLLAGLLDEQADWQGSLTASDHQPIEGRVAYMAQQDLLLPWLSVLENVCLSSRFNPKQSAENSQDRARELLNHVGLGDHIHTRPESLSGGMRQRVALARTLLQDKPIVLMDEPFSALDAVTRHKLQTLAATLLKDKTVLLITHDPQEALRLGEQILLMSGSPAAMVSLPTPQGQAPRDYTAELAQHQQDIITRLEQDYG
ncbi:ABC transporter ATP-binding protein [Photobacterium kagoshimensis]|uniref:ABC transporter ATP-binding protein n=1 Tax=Photobacterium kagoshimensis TaxID=2910242 RepID=UPI003D142F15